MTESGCRISDFAEIKFSTRKLFIADGPRAKRLYCIYLDVLQNRSTFSSQHIFREGLKQNFRDHLTSGHYDGSPSPPSLKKIVEEKNGNVNRAQRIINFKNDKTSFGRARLLQYLAKQKANIK